MCPWRRSRKKAASPSSPGAEQALWVPRVRLFQASCRDQGWIQILRAFSVGIQKANWHIPKAHVGHK